MEIRWTIFLLILGSAAVTVVPRVAPLMLLSRLQLPTWLLRFLSYVPITIMAALVGQELFASHGGEGFQLLANKGELVAAAVTFAVAILTRSLMLTVVVGVVCMWLLRRFF
ncbi:AzlD domain-containing protein [Paenibacillus cremeus]|uniref:AzlD domain-containing protein n=1 Tax=Paenibacillus cremeus TaxID=2163881 RepID=A0A559KFZ2_9BACL|nr:AzlD domain-containing protein [Paenibacillus cremeus]TVY11018.1 AzlD domain-containing protein [Paenibacillus cremeus]